MLVLKRRGGKSIKSGAGLTFLCGRISLRICVSGLLPSSRRCKTNAGDVVNPFPANLPSETPLFRVPRDLSKIPYRDLAGTGIPRKDERGRTIDVHAMRHSSIDLTMNVYTDRKLLDIHGALDGLPALSLDADPKRERIAAKLTGTDGGAPIPFAPAFAPTPGDSSKSGAIADKSDRRAVDDADDERNVVSLAGVDRKQPMTRPVIGCSSERVTRFERATGSLGSCYSTN